MGVSPTQRAISQVSTWAFRGKLITEMSFVELREAMADCCEYAARLEMEVARLQKIERPAAFTFVKDRG